MKKTSASLLVLLFLLPVAAWPATLTGYVRSIGPSESCNVGGTPVDLSHIASLTITVQRKGSITYTGKLPFDKLRRGEFVTVTGKRNKKTGVMQAESLSITQPIAEKRISGQAVIDHLPQLQQQGSAFTGIVYADGYALHVTPATKVILPAGDSLAAPNWVTYSANLQKNHNYLATEIFFTPDHPDHKDTVYKKKTDYHFHSGTCSKNALNVVRLFRVCFETLPDAQIQTYVADIGNSLIPQWQRNLPDADPAKIHFHFYVVQANYRLHATISNDAGTVIVPTNVLMKLQNNAQLAALLSADVANAISERWFRTRIKRRTASGAVLASELAMGTVVPFGGFIPEIAGGAAYHEAVYLPEVEALNRIGLRYLADANYDVFQAPIALKRLSEKHPDRDHYYAEPPVARYLEDQLALFYSSFDSSSAQTGTQSYVTFLTEVRVADPKLHDK